MNPKVDLFLEEGCGRCKWYRTPDCKVHTWTAELKLLRKIVLSCELTEELKWSQPCYTFNGNNILIVSAFKNFCFINILKGALLSDTHAILEKPGESSQSARLLKFTNVQDIKDIEATIKAYIFEAIEIEKAGLKVAFKKNPEVIPDEFQTKLDQIPELKKAFEALTPGRQRGYLLHFSQAKQAKTRESRIEKCMEAILNGKGFNEY